MFHSLCHTMERHAPVALLAYLSLMENRNCIPVMHANGLQEKLIFLPFCDDFCASKIIEAIHGPVMGPPPLCWIPNDRMLACR